MDKILLFIPMYNCEKQIVRVLAQLNQEACRYLSEVIIVNNRSTDKGEEAVVQFLSKQTPDVPVKVFRNEKNYGFGGSNKIAFNYAVKKGFDYIIVLHGDDQGDLSSLMPYLRNQAYAKYDCFLGARFMKGSRLQGYSWFRTFGNLVYNILFSVGTGRKIYDLGSGLNMYKVSILKDQFYRKYKDDLTFNYCMILGSVYYQHSIRFFPLCWREDDQVSNVKMVSQAFVVLKILASYVFHKKKFAVKDFRTEKIRCYHACIVYPEKRIEAGYGSEENI